jgi:hypothetical protein
MATPAVTPLPPSLEKTLATDFHTGNWTPTTRQLLIYILNKLIELEQRIVALEP